MSPEMVPPPRAALVRRRAALVVVAVGAVAAVFAWRRFAALPPDSTPEGAYVRVGAALDQGDARAVYALLDDDARAACVAIRDARRRASERVAAAYPEPERARLLAAYAPEAGSVEGADAWLVEAARHGYVALLRADTSGVERVERAPAVPGAAERAVVVTTRGARYPFTRRADGAFGLSAFTIELVAEAERALRDADVIDQAARDYTRGAATATPRQATPP